MAGGAESGLASAAVAAASSVILNTLAVLKSRGCLIIFTNLPPTKALPFLSSLCPTTSCVSAYDPNGSNPVTLGSGLGSDAPTATVETKDGGAITTSRLIHVYALTKVDDAVSGLALVKSLDGMRAAAAKGLEEAKKTALRGVEDARRDLLEAKALTGYDVLGTGVDDAARSLKDTIKEQIQEAEKLRTAQDTMNEVVGAGHGGALADYAKYKGKEMQGSAALYSDEGVEVGTWEQTREDVTLTFVLSNVKDAKIGAIDAKIGKERVIVTVARGDALEEGYTPGNPEFEEFEESGAPPLVYLIKTISHAFKVTESSWFVEEGTAVVVTLAKAKVGDFWPKVSEGDEEAKARDYGKVGRGMLGDDENDGVSNDGGAIEGSVKVLSISKSRIVEVAFHLTAADNKNLAEAERDYLTVVDAATPDSETWREYHQFEFCFDDSSKLGPVARGARALKLSPELPPSALLEVRLVSHLGNTVVARSHRFRPGGGVLSALSFVQDGYDVVAERSDNIGCCTLYLRRQNRKLSKDEVTAKLSRGEVALALRDDGVRIATLEASAASADVVGEYGDYVAVRISLCQGPAPGRDPDDEEDAETPKSRSTPDEVMSLRCGFCEHSLVPGAIGTVLPLPSCFWDEVGDYLSCHSDASVDFDSAGLRAVKGKAMEDERVFLLHGNDCGDRVDVLSGVEGYGEKEVRACKSR